MKEFNHDKMSEEDEKLLWEKRQKKEKFKSILTDILQVILLLFILVGIFFLIKWIISTPIKTLLIIFGKGILATILIVGILQFISGFIDL